MDVGMVQKINKLAVDLLNQGMVTSRIEAVKKAEEMLSRDGSLALSDIQEAAPAQRTAAPAPAPPPQPAQQTLPNADVEQLKTAMLKNNEYFVKTFKELQVMLSTLKQELAGIKQDVHELKKRPVAAPQPEQPTLGKVYEKVEIAKPVESASAQDSGSHPKQGTFNPEDVSVEKVFYMGNK